MFKTVTQFPNQFQNRATPRLRLPGIESSQRARPHLKSKQLERWAAELPIGNTTVACHQMLEKLKTLNRSRYPAKERIQLHNCIRAVFQELVFAVRQPLRQASIPLDRQQLYRMALLQDLLEQMATGYKLATHELALLTKPKEYDTLLLTEAIYLAMIFLNQRLIDAYSMYAPEPKQVWADLNQLYQFAETRQIHTNQVDDPFPDTPLPVYLNIDFVYKRMLLLALAEPYHLMQYETDDMYRVVASSVHACAIEPFNGIVTRGEYAIDLETDTGPRYISAQSGWQPQDARSIDISMVKTQLNVHLHRLLRTNATHGEFDHISLIERQQRDMLLRLADAWNASLVRKTQRFIFDAQVEVTSGLSAAHHFISDLKKFTPEIDELKLVSNIDESNVDDANTAFVTAYREALQKDRRYVTERFALNPWWQRNVSPIGIALNCQRDNDNIDIRVGELVAYRFSGKSPQRWQIGVTRWLQHQFDDESDGMVNVGIMNLANGAIPVGTKAIKGLGSGSDYFRALMIPKNISVQQTRSIIVPALLYDVHTVLAVNMKDKLFYARLIRVVLSTRSFTQFDFDIVKRPIEYLL